MFKITLTEEDLELAAAVTRLRSIESRWYGRGQAHGFDGDYGDLDGEKAELAFVKFWEKAFGEKLPWLITLNQTSDHLKRCGDVAGWHVRGTEHLNGHLIVRDTDPIGPYVLVIVREDCCWLPGYITNAQPWRNDPQYRSRLGHSERPAVTAIPQRDLTKWCPTVWPDETPEWFTVLLGSSPDA